ncbi:MAG: acyltransferase [Cellvibrio sp.]|uniref:acyltransferase n=1 Tax=Cellvibrio sp. TaxID=1965322 RepID=UPI002725E7AB|nr:acyltransferase [Cellvibrio sp.]
MSLYELVKRFARNITLLLRNASKRVQLYPLGLRAHSSTSIAWSVSVDAGGSGCRVRVGSCTTLDVGVILRAYGGYIEIGEYCSINPYCVLYGGGVIKIGNGVRIAPHTVIVASNHIFDDATRFIHQQGETSKGILIEDDVWIGAGVRILDGVIIRKGTVVGAGAVVTKSTECYAVVVGVPAKQISSRITREVAQNKL